MSQNSLVAGTGTTSTLISDSLVMLNSFTVSGLATGIAIHDVATVAGITVANKVYEITGNFELNPFQDAFEGLMFHKGLVVVCTCADNAHTFNLNVEWE
jgi:hypothetical protein